MSERLRLEGKTALVMGGTRGIGRAVAERYCKEGARVAIAGRDVRSGEVAVDQMRASGHKVSFAPADITDISSIGPMVEAVAGDLSGIDILVNNAGALRDGSIRRLDVKDWNYVMSTNVTGPVFCMQAVGRVMAEAGRGGSIINTASVAGIDPKFGQVSYSVAKAALIMASRVAAIEFARYDIRVNTVAPGLIETDMVANLPDGAREALIGRTLVGRVGIPEDLLGMYTLLASDEASFITGQVYRVDGGRV